jgi:hypothetical protein
MNRKTRKILARCTLAAGLALAGAGAACAGPLAFYFGGAVSRSDIRIDQVPDSPLSAWSPKTNGWKAFVGWRPISLLGFEASYRDLGSESAVASTQFVGYTATYTGRVHATATTLQGLVYAPIPLPFLDLYGKVGISRLAHRTSLDTQCSPAGAICDGLSGTRSVGGNKSVANLGAGVQVKVASVALRAEVEQDMASGGDPRQVSVGVSWEF